MNCRLWNLNLNLVPVVSDRRAAFSILHSIPFHSLPRIYIILYKVGEKRQILDSEGRDG